MKNYKKITALFLATLMIVALAVGTVDTQAAVKGDWRYEVDRDDGRVQVEIDRYLGKAKNVVVPEKLGGYKVTEIDDDAFKGNKYIEQVTIKGNIRDIGEGAFEATPRLKKFVVRNNSKYKAVGGVLVKKKNNYIVAYPEAKGATYNIPDAIKGIDDEAFKGNKTIKKVVFNKVKVIGEEAFMNTPALKAVELGRTVTKIEEEALGYTREDVKLKGFTIKGYKNTVAHKYAVRNGIKFTAK